MCWRSHDVCLVTVVENIIWVFIRFSSRQCRYFAVYTLRYRLLVFETRLDSFIRGKDSFSLSWIRANAVHVIQLFFRSGFRMAFVNSFLNVINVIYTICGLEFRLFVYMVTAPFFWASPQLVARISPFSLMFLKTVVCSVSNRRVENKEFYVPFEWCQKLYRYVVTGFHSRECVNERFYISQPFTEIDIGSSFPVFFTWAEITCIYYMSLLALNFQALYAALYKMCS